MPTKQIVIHATDLFDGKQRKENQFIIIEENQIIDVTDKPFKADYRGIVTPAFLDAHSHIGMDREGEPYQESECNDHMSQFNPLNDPLNSIYMDDRAFSDAVDFGVLYSCIVPGSGNLLGGKARIIRNFANHVKDAFFRDYGFKMALGFNPRSTTIWKGDRPNTRMGVYALLEKKLKEVLQKSEKAELTKQKKKYELSTKRKDKKISQDGYDHALQIIDREFDLELSIEEKTILELLSGTKTAKIHVHKDDDVHYLIKLVSQFGIKATADHTGDVFHAETFDALREHNIPVVYGPLGCVGYKVELKHAYYQNAKLLMDSSATYGLMTDHPVIHTMALRDSLKFFLIQGLSEVDAISLITYQNAKILQVDDQLGSIEKGKLASLLVWDNNPLHLGAFPRTVLAEGKVIRK